MNVRSGEELRGEDLLERVAQLARTLAEAGSLDDLLQRIVDLGNDHIGGCESASVSFIHARRRLSTPVHSSRLAYDSDQAQYRTGQGPCLDSIARHETVVIDDLDEEERWPAWRDAMLGMGVRSTISFRLFVLRGHDDDTMGALNMYATVPRAFDARSVAVGQVFASHAAVALKAAITEAGLHRALATRDLIGQAKGVLMEREKLLASEAFQRLRELSQHHNVPITDLASKIAASGEIPPLSA